MLLGSWRCVYTSKLCNRTDLLLVCGDLLFLGTACRKISSSYGPQQSTYIYNPYSIICMLWLVSFHVNKRKCTSLTVPLPVQVFKIFHVSLQLGANSQIVTCVCMCACVYIYAYVCVYASACVCVYVRCVMT